MTTAPAASGRRPALVALASLCVAAILAGCGFFSNAPLPSTALPSLGIDSSPDAVTPAPTSRPVRSIALIADVGESEAGTASALAWKGVQWVATDLGAASSMKIPKSARELWNEVQAAATTGATVVVTVGADAGAATRTAALANPSVEFFALDQPIADGAPGNLHVIVFDESEMGYLAGVIAASLSRTGSVGLVGDENSDTATENYAAGFRNGARLANPAAVVALANAGSPDDPAKGRAAVASLIAGQADVVAAILDVSGIGAMREACARNALVIALDTDAWLLAPDVRPCLAASVLKLYDVEIVAAILLYARGGGVAGSLLGDAAAGGIGLTDFHVFEPATLTDLLKRVTGDMRAGPPRPTAAPPSTATAAPATSSPTSWSSLTTAPRPS